MAKWLCYRRSNGNLVLIYVNTVTGQSMSCGEMRPDVPEDMIVDWVLNEGDPGHGDIITFSSGRVAQILPYTGIA